MIYSKGSAFSIILIATALSIIGWLVIPYLSLSLEKEQKGNSLNINTNWPNSSAQQVERELTRLIEAAISNIDGISNINSVSKKNQSSIDIEISKLADRDQLRLNLLQSIRRLYGQLPAGALFPQIKQANSSMDRKALLIYTLRSNEPSEQVENYANNHIKAKLAFIKGLDDISVFGANKLEAHIIYDVRQMQKLDIEVQHITKAIQQYYNDENIGWTLLNDHHSTPVFQQIKLSANKASHLQSIPIANIAGRIIKLGQIAEIDIQEKEADEYFRINGQDAIHIVINALPNTNALSLVKEVEKELALIQNELPKGYSLEESYKSTKFINQELQKIYSRTLFTILILLLFVILVSLNGRYVLMIILSLMTTISISFLLYYIFKIDIHLYSLAGITVSLGLIIDNSIIMADHLLHRGDLKVYTAILASTLTTAASLIVIWFLPQELKLNLWDFAAIISINLFVSLVIALFYLPALLEILKLKSSIKRKSIYRKRGIVKWNKVYSKLLTISLKHRKWALIFLLWMFGIPFFLLPNEIEGDSKLAKVYNSSFGSEWYHDHLKTPVNKYLGGSLRLFNFYVFENSYYSKPEETKLYIDAAMPKGANIQQLNKIMESMEAFLSSYENTIKYQTSIRSPQYANISIQFDKDIDPIFPYVLKSKLISNSLNLGGLSWNIYGVGKGFSQSEGLSETINFKLALKGFKLSELNDWAAKIKVKLEEHPRVNNVNTSANKRWWKRGKSYEYVAEIDMEKLAYHQIDLNHFINEIKLQTNNFDQELSFSGFQDFKTMRLYPKNTHLKDDWTLLNTSSGPYKTGDFMEIKEQEEEEAIYKENQSYLKLIDFKYIGSMKFANTFKDKVVEEIKSQLPLGYSINSVENYRVNKDSYSYIFALLLIVFLMYFICSILFESLTWPFAIILMVPLSFIGIFLTFYQFDFNFDQGGYASFILVGGLVVNASIYLLNDYSNLKKQNHQTPLRNYIKSFNRKIIPILLTIISTVLGLLPFVMSGQNEVFWFALAIGTIGGLLFSILLLIFFFPLFFLRKPMS